MKHSDIAHILIMQVKVSNSVSAAISSESTHARTHAPDLHTYVQARPCARMVTLCIFALDRLQEKQIQFINTAVK